MSAPTYQQVLAATREHMAAKGIRTTSWVVIDLASQFGINIERGNWDGYRNANSTRLEGQVRRALEALTADGTLIKRIVHTHGRRKEAEYETPDHATARMREGRLKAEAKGIGRTAYVTGFTGVVYGQDDHYVYVRVNGRDGTRIPAELVTIATEGAV